MGIFLGELVDRDVAVNCGTPDEAYLLLEQLILSYPEETKYWRTDDLHWEPYGKRTCYAMYREGDFGSKRLVYSPDHFFSGVGYQVISFGDLMTGVDLGEIDSAGVNLLTLFGKEVQGGD